MATSTKTIFGKDDLARAFAVKTGTTLADARKLVGAFIEVITKTLEASDLQLVGFGSFRRVSRPEHQGRNPKTGEVITVPATSVVRFKPAAALRMRAEKTVRRKAGAGPDGRAKPSSKPGSPKRR